MKKNILIKLTTILLILLVSSTPIYSLTGDVPPPHDLVKQFSENEGELGDIVHVTITVSVPDGEYVELEDTLPDGLSYIAGSFMVDGEPVDLKVKKGVIIYTLDTPGSHTIEYDVIVDTAKNWEEMEASNTAYAKWYDSEDLLVEEKESEASFTVLAFEELHKNVGIPKADVVFAVDLTGSMGDELSTVKSEAVNIMNSLSAQIADVQFGLISFMDYDGLYSTTESGSVPETYTATYGSVASGDYPYMLDQDITDDTTIMDTAINSLVLGYGVDDPEDYTRIIHESWNDANLHWRTDATRFLIMFGDNVPHDTNFDYDDDGTLENTGGDPGRDATIGTGDDLDFETEVSNAAAAGVHILGVYSGSSLTRYPWEYMASETEGGYFELTDAEDIPDAINDLIKAEAEKTLTINVGEDAQWAVVIDVVNTYPYMMEDIVITDRFGAEIEFDELVSVTHGSYELKTKGKSEKLFLTWEIGDLVPGVTARLILLVSTDLNPAGHQEYTSPGIYELNSGATLKFKNPDGVQLSACTDNIWTTVLE